MRFSEKKGHTPIRNIIQKDNIDSALRNKLWNVIQICIWNKYSANTLYKTTLDSNLCIFFTLVWNNFLKKPLDEIPHTFPNAVQNVRNNFFSWPWVVVYDFIEFIAQTNLSFPNSNEFQKACNHVLEQEKSGYRFLNREIVEITNEEELHAIELAIDNSSKFSGVQTHLKTAIKHLADRQNPDFRNSIKESISAVKSLCKEITQLPNATLGSTLTELKKRGKFIRPRNQVFPPYMVIPVMKMAYGTQF